MCTTTILNHSGKHYYYLEKGENYRMGKKKRERERRRVLLHFVLACEKDCDLSVASLREGATFFDT